ncbi:hypothetical protein B0H14DRAFT_3728779 [Mycena olivaceomarginata]|nr:hypothetical protein B0H14DRAFT_3728779 [Mycena olivaceomarginata]
MRTDPIVRSNLGLFRRSAIQRVPEKPWWLRVLLHITYGCPASVASHPKSALLHYYQRKNEVELNSPGGSMHSSGCEAGAVEAARYSDLLRRVVVEIYRGFAYVQVSKAPDEQECIGATGYANRIGLGDETRVYEKLYDLIVRDDLRLLKRSVEGRKIAALDIHERRKSEEEKETNQDRGTVTQACSVSGKARLVMSEPNQTGANQLVECAELEISAAQQEASDLWIVEVDLCTMYRGINSPSALLQVGEDAPVGWVEWDATRA